LIVAVYSVPAARSAAGSSVTVFVAAAYVTVAATGVGLPCGINVTVVVVIVDAVIAFENVPVTLLVTATPVAPAGGLTVGTVGAVASVNDAT
jgi:hypothetical protein